MSRLSEIVKVIDRHELESLGGTFSAQEIALELEIEEKHTVEPGFEILDFEH